MNFVERIDFKLLEKNLKRFALCENVGISSTAITDWKRRGTIPAGDVCLKIADYLGVSVEWLVTGEEKKEQEITMEEKTFIRDFENLTEFQKRTIKVLMDNYKKENSENLKKDSVS